VNVTCGPKAFEVYVPGGSADTAGLADGALGVELPHAEKIAAVASSASRRRTLLSFLSVVGRIESLPTIRPTRATSGRGALAGSSGREARIHGEVARLRVVG
jgi:hypothetical protein